MSKRKQRRPDLLEEAIYVALWGLVAVVGTAATAAASWVVVNAPTQLQGATIVSHLAVGIGAAAVVHLAIDEDRARLQRKVDMWDRADTRADLDVVGPITGESKAVPFQDFEDPDSIPEWVDEEVAS